MTRALRQLPVQAVLLAFALVIAFPLVWLFFDSFKSNTAIFSSPWSLPTRLEWSNYLYDIFRADILGYMGNSVVVSVATVLLTLALGSPLAYALANFQFRLSGTVYLLFVLLLIVPVQVAVIPLYVIVTKLGLANTYWALILPYTSSSLPFCVFFLRAFFQNIPGEIADAARIDGCSDWQAFSRIVLPVSRPGLATVVILTFLGAWNEFFLALIFIHSPWLQTLPLGLNTFYYQYQVQYNYLFAALVMAIFPIVAVYLAMQRQFIEGLTAGALR